MSDFQTIEARDLDTAAAYRLITACVLPRPIAWITSCNAEGLVNIAPFSSYNYVAHTPPMVAVNIGIRDGRLKDTARNITDTHDFVVNIPSEANLELLHKTSADYGPEVSEAELHHIALLPSRVVKAPRIAETPIQLECRLSQIVPLGPGVNTLYIGEVLAFHLSDDIFDGRHVDVAKLRPLMRLAGPNYATLGEIIYREPVFKAPGLAAKTEAAAS